MFSLRTVVSSAIASIALFSSVQIASAITVQITTPYTSAAAAADPALVQGTLSAGGDSFALNPSLTLITPAPFTHYYKFDTAAGGVQSNTLIQVHFAPPAAGVGGIANLEIHWLNAAFAAIGPGLDVTTAAGAFEAGRSDGEVFTQALNAGTVYLLVTGSRIGDKGRYDFDILATECTTCGNDVPVPGAVFLFGSVLAGGVGGMQLMRRRRARAA